MDITITIQLDGHRYTATLQNGVANVEVDGLWAGEGFWDGAEIMDFSGVGVGNSSYALGAPRAFEAVEQALRDAEAIVEHAQGLASDAFHGYPRDESDEDAICDALAEVNGLKLVGRELVTREITDADRALFAAATAAQIEICTEAA